MKEIIIGNGRGECRWITIENPYDESKIVLTIDYIGMRLICLIINDPNEIQSDSNIFYLDLLPYPNKTVTVYDVFQKFGIDFEETIDRCDLNLND